MIDDDNDVHSILGISMGSCQRLGLFLLRVKMMVSLTIS